MNVPDPNGPAWYLRNRYPPATPEEDELVTACHYGDIEALRPLLPHVAKSDNGRNAPLWAACYNGHLEIVRLLLKHGADPHSKGWNYCAIFHAAAKGHTEIVRLLLDQGVSLRGLKYDCPFETAAGHGHLEVVKLLAERGGADVHKFEEFAMRMAVQNGHLDVVRYLIEEKGANINACEHTGEGSLAMASRNNHVKLVQYLLEKGAETRGDGGDFALINAVRNQNIEILRLLLESKDGVNIHVNEGVPIRLAASYGWCEGIKLLLEYGADVRSRGDCAILWATINKHVDAAKLLLDHGANPKEIHEDIPAEVKDYAWRLPKRLAVLGWVMMKGML
jgi:ankyrin repeat protein